MIDNRKAREDARQYGLMGAAFGVGLVVVGSAFVALFPEGREFYANLRHFDPASIGLVATEIDTAAIATLAYEKMSYDGELRRQGIYKG